jgi:hypothetical protein
MSADKLKDRLADIPVPQSGTARERAVAEARAEVARVEAERAASGAGSRRTRRGLPPLRQPLAGVAATALLVLVVLLTPPGRAASAWVGDLVGIGDVGGAPSAPKQGGFIKGGTAVVVDNGTAPDGSRYEWVAFQCKADLRDEGLDTNFEGIGLALQWPGVRDHEGGGSCESLEDRPRPGAFVTHGVHIVPSQFKGVAEPDLVISGATGPDVDRVRVIYRDGDGDPRDLPLDFARVEGKLQQLASRPERMSTFVAFLPGEVAARDEVESRLDIRALHGTGKLKLGPIGRRERAQVREAHEACRRFEVDPATAPRNAGRRQLERLFAPMRECQARHAPKGPFEYVAYDESGKVIERMTEPLTGSGVLRAAELADAEGREEPGDRRARRPGWGGATESKLVMSGRTPDGALYEYWIEQTKYGFCTTMFWPYGGGPAMGGCGKELPPSTAYGRRDPEGTFAHAYPILSQAAGATTSRWVEGFARPNVARVRVVYRDRSGARHEAPVKLVQVTLEELGEIDASEPFGRWTAFVPRSAGRARVEITAYDAAGRRLGETLTHESPLING